MSQSSVAHVLPPMILLLGLAAAGVAQRPPGPPPPPPHGPGPHPGERLPELQDHLRRLQPVNSDAAAALHLARYFLAQAQTALRNNQRFLADRYAAAADAQTHIAEHQEHLLGHGGPTPPPDAVADHLQHVYFRLQQANYFRSLIHDDHANDLPQRGRNFYEKAIQAYDQHDVRTADEYAKCVDDTVRTLEELAQAANGSPRPPPAPPRP